MSIIPVEETLAYINEARTNPKGFAKYVKAEIELFTDEMSMPLYKGCSYSTNQGKKAWLEALWFLQKHEPLGPYKLNKGLCLACEDHAHDMATHNFFGHASFNGQGFGQRIERRCGKAYGASGQNIGSEFRIEGRNHALKTVLGLIIDDGVSSRGHRKNIFSTDFKVIGIYSVALNDKIATVLDFHSEDLQLIDATKPKQSQAPHKPASKPLEHRVDKISHNGEKRIVSQSTSVNTSTINGKTKQVKTVTIEYSDGSQQKNIEETFS